MTVYALHHPDGRRIYHLPRPEDRTFTYATGRQVLADGQPMTALHGDWWATDHEASELKWYGEAQKKTVGYRLKDRDAESVRYPATLTVDERNERADDERLWDLYETVTEDQPAPEHVYDGPIIVLEGREPPAPDQPQWVAALPHALTERPEYKHLFPGHIPGLVSHLMARIEQLPRVEHVFDNFQDRRGVYVSLRVPFDPPQTSWRPYLGRKGQPLKSGRTVTEMASRSLTLPIPDRIAGDTYDEALAVWEQQIAYWLQVVEEASVAACGACGGKGHVEQGSEQYSRK